MLDLAAYLEQKRLELAATGKVMLAVRVKAEAAEAGWLGLLSEEGPVRLAVTAPAVKGRANGAVIAWLAAFFGVAKQQVVIKRGLMLPNKLVEIRQ